MAHITSCHGANNHMLLQATQSVQQQQRESEDMVTFHLKDDDGGGLVFKAKCKKHLMNNMLNANREPDELNEDVC